MLGAGWDGATLCLGAFLFTGGHDEDAGDALEDRQVSTPGRTHSSPLLLQLPHAGTASSHCNPN